LERLQDLPAARFDRTLEAIKLRGMPS
jgi:hypothetical protein